MSLLARGAIRSPRARRAAGPPADEDGRGGRGAPAAHRPRPAGAPAAGRPRGAPIGTSAWERSRRCSSRSARSRPRPVRRHGMKPLVEAVVADPTGIEKAASSTSPGWQTLFSARDAADAGGQVPGAATAFASTHLDRRGGRRRRRRRHVGLSRDRGLSRRRSWPLVREHREAGETRRRVASHPASGRKERLPDLAAAYEAAHFGDHEGGRRRLLAFDELLLDQLVQIRLRAHRRDDASAEAARCRRATLTAHWRADSLPFTPDGRSASARCRRSMRTWQVTGRCSGC